MKIKNLTSESQELRVSEIVSGREFSIYIEGNSVTDLTDAIIKDTNKIGKIFEIVGNYPKIVKEIPAAIEEIVEEELESETPEETIADSEEPQEETSITTEDRFICDFCGAEFASARGLTSHKNRVHLEENK